MKITLNIKEDKELRDYIKEMIKNQVKAVTREEIKNILREELERKTKGTDILNFEYIVKREVKDMVYNELLKSKYYNHTPYIKEVATEEIRKVIKEIFNKGSII